MTQQFCDWLFVGHNKRTVRLSVYVERSQQRRSL